MLMNPTRRRYLQLLEEEVKLVQIEEIFNRAGERDEARCVREERLLIRTERQSLKQRMHMKAVK